MNGNRISLNKNSNANSLHGGNIGFSQKIWKVKKVNEGKNPSVTLTYFSPNKNTIKNNNNNCFEFQGKLFSVNLKYLLLI